MKFYGKIQSGKMSVLQQWRMGLWIKQQPDMAVEIEISKASNKRSTQQNAYYWGVVLPILCAHFEGYTKDEMHDAMKIKFLSLHEDNPEKLQTIRSTAKLNTDEFKAYIEQIQRWAAEFAGVDIPDPGEGTFDGGDE